MGETGPVRQPRHRPADPVLRNRAVGTWCVWDTPFRPALVSEAAMAEWRRPVAGRRIGVEVDPVEGVAAATPADTCLSFLAGLAPFGGEAGPFGGVVTSGFCRWIHLVAGAEAAEAWGRSSDAAGRPAAGQPGLTVLWPAGGVRPPMTDRPEGVRLAGLRPTPPPSLRPWGDDRFDGRGGRRERNRA
jgi:hypothetical protein